MYIQVPKLGNMSGISIKIVRHIPRQSCSDNTTSESREILAEKKQKTNLKFPGKQLPPFV